MQNIQFEVIIEAEKDSEILVLPPHIYKSLMEESAPMANFSNQIMASHFSEVMWLIEQIMWKSFDKRLAAFLVEETLLENTDILKITHEKIANHLGTAREVVTRMLRYFRAKIWSDYPVEPSRSRTKKDWKNFQNELCVYGFFNRYCTCCKL